MQRFIAPFTFSLCLASAAFAQGALPVQVAHLAGAQCSQQHAGWAYTCRWQHYDITADPPSRRCAQDGLYGNIQTDSPGLTLLDRPAGGKPVARLKNRQFVCVSADARQGNQEVQWYYVTAITVGSVAACRGRKLCGGPGDLPIESLVPGTGVSCHRDAKGNVVGDCASGWVRTEDLELFANGI
ncbi:hypothetical protein [Dyella sp.]|uniref:hypothetical protein n=1 Tax=Dyella sp. TaxID=1869338 RepID=UPI002ED12430